MSGHPVSLTLAAVSAGCLVLAACAPARGGARAPDLLPRPRVATVGAGGITLAGPGDGIALSAPPEAAGPAAEGVALFCHRVAALGSRAAPAPPESAAVALRLCPETELRETLARAGITEAADAAQIRQAYHLRAGGADTGVRVRLAAAHPLGLYYGLVTLCQLVEADAAGGVCVPEIDVLDFPAVARRLAKVSASSEPPDAVRRFADWLPLVRINQLGLQYHGGNSKNPEAPFPEAVSTLCPRLRDTGTLESVVYFCPFRGGAGATYDFGAAADRIRYAEYLRWILRQGAHGVEVDYNDWPGSAATPVADVLNLACRTIAAERTDAYVLYCPPLQGAETYHGAASGQMRRTLAAVPPEVWPLWTGPTVVTGKSVTVEDFGEWTSAAGRRPFFWLNRVSPSGNGAFARRLEGPDGGDVFPGERLPENLGRLVEGVHLNMSTPFRRPAGDAAEQRRAFEYLATAADWLWNPEGWDAADSLRRAKRFVARFQPGVAD